MRAHGLSRRALLRTGGAVGGLLTLNPAVSELTASIADVAAEGGQAQRKNVYESIGVRPMINGRGTYTIISGSLLLPEARKVIDQAARYFVHLDELADAVGKRLAEITGAEFGMVSSGCAAALTHATAACVAGGNPDLHIRLPDLTGFQKTEVIIPKHSRNVYEAAVSAIGVRVVQVETREELRAALGRQTALVYIFAGPREAKSELDVKSIARIAKKHDVPVLVDAAAEVLTIPNVHLRNGADLVGYSGGKAIRGPQSAGLLLGREDLVRAAWMHSAPHHGVGRGYKVGKEETISMLTAVEMWTKRDHDAEWRQWTSWLEHIADRASKVRGVSTEIVQPEGLSNRTPSLRVLWDEAAMGVSGQTVVDALYEGDPRVAINQASSDDPPRTGVSVTPYMMSKGEERVVADRLVEVLRDPPDQPDPPDDPPAADLTGRWQVAISYVASRSTSHVLRLQQHGSELTGTHEGEFVERPVTGSIHGDQVELHSFYGEEHGDALDFTFTGEVAGKTMRGALDMGEYLTANWTAERT